MWIRGTVPERRGTQIIEVTALEWDRRLALVEQLLEPLLLGQRVDQFERGDSMLCFNNAPAAARQPATLRR
jgi:hypothetical protein